MEENRSGRVERRHVWQKNRISNMEENKSGRDTYLAGKEDMEENRSGRVERIHIWQEKRISNMEENTSGRFERIYKRKDKRVAGRTERKKSHSSLKGNQNSETNRKYKQN